MINAWQMRDLFLKIKHLDPIKKRQTCFILFHRSLARSFLHKRGWQSCEPVPLMLAGMLNTYIQLWSCVKCVCRLHSWEFAHRFFEWIACVLWAKAKRAKMRFALKNRRFAIWLLKKRARGANRSWSLFKKEWLSKERWEWFTLF